MSASRRYRFASTCHRELSPREAEVAKLIAKGLDNNNIAYVLGVSESCVKKHVQHAFAKLKIQNRTQLALWIRDNAT